MKTTIFCAILTILVPGYLTYKEKSKQETEFYSKYLQNTKLIIQKANQYETQKLPCGSKRLDQLSSYLRYESYKDETLQFQEGYGVYFYKAYVKLEKDTVDDCDPFLKIHYELPPYFSFGNWVSIRKEFIFITDVSSCTGITLKLFVKNPSDTILRFTFCDIKENSDMTVHGADEMWWYDFEDNTLNKENNWQTLIAPFNEFRQSNGEGTRHNDGNMDISKFVAYEINIISKEGQYSKGDIFIKSINTY